MGGKTTRRKLEHIKVCLREDVEARSKRTGFGDIEFVHRVAPEIDFEDINIRSPIFGKDLEAPIMISAMTGGHRKGRELNLALAEASQELGIAFTVGSQKAALKNPKLENTYRVREVAPDVFLLGNLGMDQIQGETGVEMARKALEMIDADALSIHLNPLQEVVQSGGEPHYNWDIESFAEVSSKLNCYTLIKETGAGIDGFTASKFVDAGANAIDVSGAGGTSWARVEAARKSTKSRFGELFGDWGIPTTVSTAEVAANVDVPVIVSGGVRTGVDAAKAFALGGDLVGIALPLLRASIKGKEKVIEWLSEFIQELRLTMFLTGCRSMEELSDIPLIITGKTKDWFASRGLKPEKYGQRGERR